MSKAPIIVAAAICGLAACASQTTEQKEDPYVQQTRDYIVDAQLPSVEGFMLRRPYRVTRMNSHFVMLETSDDYFLVEFDSDCVPTTKNLTATFLFGIEGEGRMNRIMTGHTGLPGCRVQSIHEVPPEVGKQTYLESLEAEK